MQILEEESARGHSLRLTAHKFGLNTTYGEMETATVQDTLSSWPLQNFGTGD